MVFSDPVFVYAFLPAVLLLYWAFAWRRRNVFVAAVGTIFYMWGGGAFITLLVASVLANHGAAVLIDRWREVRPGRALWIKRLVVSADLVALGVWKYAGFLAAQSSSLLGRLGVHAEWHVDLALPIAISFFTFQSVSYVIDVARGDASPATTVLDYAAYILLFPHLIAGPIVRYSAIRADIESPYSHRLTDFRLGAPRFFWGLAKKVVVADQVAALADAAFGEAGHPTFATAWIGALAFAVQIYFDFSGYSDMAIGLARMLGFHFPENFDHPYAATSVTDFWRRWHISLSTWFRDYLYIPLGGSRGSRPRTYVNLWLVFLATGLWHGAAWTFIVWGAYHGLLLSVERATGLRDAPRGAKAIPRRLATFGLVVIGWVVFRAESVTQAWRFVSAMLTPSGLGFTRELELFATTQRLAFLMIGLTVVLAPSRWHFGRAVSDDRHTRDPIRLGVVAVVAPIACVYVLSGTFSPFLYFKF